MQLNKTAFVSALNTFVAQSNEITKTLRRSAVDAGFKHWELAEPVVIEWAAQRYGCAVKVSQSPRNKGQQVLDSTSKGYEAAKTAVRRVREAMTGDADAPKAEGAGRSNKADKMEVPAEIAALAARLVAACNEYDLDDKGLKALAAQAIAEAFAAK